MLALPPHAHVDGRWQLGRGASAIVYEQGRWPGSTIALRTLEIRRGRIVVQRFRNRDEGIRIVNRDVTGDGVKDVLAFDDQDGSGGCGAYRLYGGPRLRELYVHRGCGDTFAAKLDGGALVTWSAVESSKEPKTGSYPHCCWRLWRRSERRWSGARLRLVRRTLGPPPPSYSAGIGHG